jgi:hypothetical protein
VTQEELITLVTAEIKGLSTKFVAGDYTNAVAEALRETGWAFPITVSFQITWTKRRTKRHLFYMLMTESATKTKFEQINQQQKFEHFAKLVEQEDKDFVNSEPYQFAGVSASHMFGVKIDAGFAYDEVGRDLTYESENTIIVTPSESD